MCTYTEKIIMKTCPCNVHPFSPHFYIVKLDFTGVNIFSYFCSKHRLWGLVRIASRVPIIYVLSKNKKNVTFFHLKITIFTAVKYCSILHGYVCVMYCLHAHKVTPAPKQTLITSNIENHNRIAALELSVMNFSGA